MDEEIKVYIILKSFSSMKCVSGVSVAKHGIISNVMVQIDFFFFFQMGFFVRHCWPPGNQLHTRAALMQHEKLTFKELKQFTQQENSPFMGVPFSRLSASHVFWTLSPLLFG